MWRREKGERRKLHLAIMLKISSYLTRVCYLTAWTLCSTHHRPCCQGTSSCNESQLRHSSSNEIHIFTVLFFLFSHFFLIFGCLDHCLIFYVVNAVDNPPYDECILNIKVGKLTSSVTGVLEFLFVKVSILILESPNPDPNNGHKTTRDFYFIFGLLLLSLLTPIWFHSFMV